MPLKICEVLAEAENTLRVAGIPEYKNDAWLLFYAAVFRTLQEHSSVSDSGIFHNILSLLTNVILLRAEK